jgi:hypothetical protein
MLTYPFFGRELNEFFPDFIKNGDFIYLEEDVEANDFLVELRQRGIQFDITEEILDDEWEGRNYAPNRELKK